MTQQFKDIRRQIKTTPFHGMLPTGTRIVKADNVLAIAYPNKKNWNWDSQPTEEFEKLFGVCAAATTTADTSFFHIFMDAE